MGGILLESRSESGDTDNNHLHPQVSLWLRDPDLGATSKSWMLGDTHHGITITGQGAYKKDGKWISPRSRVSENTDKQAVFSEGSENDYCVSIEPGLTSLFGYFNGALSHGATDTEKFQSNVIQEIYSGNTEKDKEIIENVSIDDFSVYAVNGLVSGGRICSAKDILAKNALYADTVNAKTKIRSRGHIVSNDYIQSDGFIVAYGGSMYAQDFCCGGPHDEKWDVTLKKHTHKVSGWQNFTVTAAGTTVSQEEILNSIGISSTAADILKEITVTYMNNGDNTGIEGSTSLYDYACQNPASYSSTMITGCTIHKNNVDTTTIEDCITITAPEDGITTDSKEATFTVSTKGNTSSADGTTSSNITLNMTSSNSDFSIEKEK